MSSDDPADERPTDADASETEERAVAPDTTDTDDTTTMTETETEAETEPDSPEATSERVRRALNYLLLAGLAIFALVAAVGFYTASTSAISTWVTREYRPLVRAAFNLVVLLVVGAGIVRQVRRLS